MSGLFGTLDVALQSLLTQQGALRATTDNLGNLNTEGYARRRPVIQEQVPTYDGNILFGRGAVLSSIQSIRDRVLELRISSEQQRNAADEAFIGSLSTVETLFGDGTDSLGSRMQAFFNSLNQLSTTPTDSSLRQAVLVAASNLASTFNSVSTDLRLQSSQIDQSVNQTVDEINRLTESIAALNMQVSSRTALGQEPGTLEDQRTVLISQLSCKIDVYTCDTPNGLTLTTVNGEPLVVAGESYWLSSVVDGATGKQHIFSGGTDLTGDIRGGKLGGLLSARDQEIDSLNTTLDNFAFDFATAANLAHHAGFDLLGNPGSDLFQVGGTASGAASTISLAIANPAELAASSDTVTGGNGNLLNLLKLLDSHLSSGDTPAGVYASLVFQVGGALANAKADQQAGEVVLNQLNDFRGSISGVSLDEESANLVRFQQAYQASARVIQTINEMLDVAVNLGRS